MTQSDPKNDGLWASVKTTDEQLNESQIRETLIEAFAQANLKGKRVLVIIPDSTRTAPMPMMFGLLNEILGSQAGQLDYLVALGTHQPMSDSALGKLIGAKVSDRKVGKHNIFNHRWDIPETFAQIGVITAKEVEKLSEGRLSLEVPVRVNKMALTYDRIIVCGPIFPHEVVGFSGGNKYFFPGISSPEMINVTHWLGALITNAVVIGTTDTPIRRMIDHAASMISTPKMHLGMVMHGCSLAGLFAGTMEAAWLAATQLSAELDIVYVEKPFKRVLSIIPQMYDDLWTGAKGMYKMEPAIADGGEVVIYAPHITEVSYTHGDIIDQVGYHVRDYFLKQWDRFKDYPWGILAHSTHVRGGGSFENNIEQARIDVTLATGIAKDRCEKIGLGYMDPGSINIAEWENREDEGLKVVHHAGEVLFRCKGI